MIGALGINRDITDGIKKVEQLESLAHYDYLTKIPNRPLLFDRIEHLIARSKRNQLLFALFYIDLDNFKMINDTKGHAYGDQLLIEVALRLQQSIRNSDTVARIGGDEFVIVLENIIDKNDIKIMFEALTKTLKTDIILNNQKQDVSCSIGVASYPDDGQTVDELLSVADSEMYKLKRKNLK